MVDLRLQSSVLLLGELELEFNDLLLLPEVRNQRTQLSELRVCIVCRLCVTGVCSSRGRRLLDASSVSADGLEVLVQQIVLLVEVLASDKKVSQYDGLCHQITYRDCKSEISLSNASRCCCQLVSELESLA